MYCRKFNAEFNKLIFFPKNDVEHTNLCNKTLKVCKFCA